MDAAESLIAEHDSYAVPLREIVKRAGQKTNRRSSTTSVTCKASLARLMSAAG